MVKEDRRLRLDGYELYRFGAAVTDTTLSDGKYLAGEGARRVVVEFFNQLWLRHGVKR
jgi:hypothetical protein